MRVAQACLTLLVALCGVFLYVLFNARGLALLPYLLVAPSEHWVPPKYSDGDTELIAGNVFTHRFVNVQKTLATQTQSSRTTDATYHIVTAGPPTGEPVVFLHGLCETWFGFYRQMIELSARGYYCLSIDIKGFGQSSKPYSTILFPELNEVGGDFSREMIASEIVTSLYHLGIPKFNLVATDLGGWYGHFVAGLFPEHILRYASLNIAIAVNNRASIGQSMVLLNVPRKSTYLLEAVPQALPRMLTGNYGNAWFVPRGIQKDARVLTKLPETITDRIVADVYYPFEHGPRKGRPSVYASWAAFYNHFPKPLPWVTLSNMQVFHNYTFPVLILQGTNDLGQPANTYDGSLRWDCPPLSSPEASPEIRPLCIVVASGQPSKPGWLPWGGLFPNYTTAQRADFFFPNSPLVHFEFVEAGHFLAHERPELITKKLTLFLQDELKATASFGKLHT